MSHIPWHVSKGKASPRELSRFRIRSSNCSGMVQQMPDEQSQQDRNNIAFDSTGQHRNVANPACPSISDRGRPGRTSCPHKKQLDHRRVRIEAGNVCCCTHNRIDNLHLHRIGRDRHLETGCNCSQPDTNRRRHSMADNIRWARSQCRASHRCSRSRNRTLIQRLRRAHNLHWTSHTP